MLLKKFEIKNPCHKAGEGTVITVLILRVKKRVDWFQITYIWNGYVYQTFAIGLELSSYFFVFSHRYVYQTFAIGLEPLYKTFHVDYRYVYQGFATVCAKIKLIKL